MKYTIALIGMVLLLSSCTFEKSEDPFNYSAYNNNAQAEYSVNFRMNGRNYSIVQEYGKQYPTKLGAYFYGGRWKVVAEDTTSANKFTLNLEFNNYSYGSSESRQFDFVPLQLGGHYSNRYLSQKITGTNVSVNLTKYTAQKLDYFEGTFSGIIGNTDSLTPPPVTVMNPVFIDGSFKVQYK